MPGGMDISILTRVPQEFIEEVGMQVTWVMATSCLSWREELGES